MNVTKLDSDWDETSYQSYLLRIWKTDQGTFKGYLMDPITRKTYPLVNIPSEKQVDASTITVDIQGIWIEPVGCWLGIWKQSDRMEDLT
jgi:hypothetical protein